jgi:hypothetical protein
MLASFVALGHPRPLFPSQWTWLHLHQHGALVVQSSEQAPFTSEIVGLILTALLKVVAFVQMLLFPPAGKVDRVG